MPCHCEEHNVHCAVKVPGALHSPNGRWVNRYKPGFKVKAVLSRSALSNSTFQYPLLASKMGNGAGLQRELIHRPYMVWSTSLVLLQRPACDSPRRIALVALVHSY